MRRRLSRRCSLNSHSSSLVFSSPGSALSASNSLVAASLRRSAARSVIQRCATNATSDDRQTDRTARKPITLGRHSFSCDVSRARCRSYLARQAESGHALKPSLSQERKLRGLPLGPTSQALACRPSYAAGFEGMGLFELRHPQQFALADSVSVALPWLSLYLSRRLEA